MTAKMDAVAGEIAAARHEARTLHEAALSAISAVAEGQVGKVGIHEHIHRRFDEYHRELTNRHLAPLKASASNHERRITVLEKRAP